VFIVPEPHTGPQRRYVGRPLNDAFTDWLADVRGVMLGIAVDSAEPDPDPLTFLLGAGSSYSSGGPRTADILKSCREARGNAFGSDEEVYEWFSSRLANRERNRIIRPLFSDTTPYVGYRCLAAMADARPIIVVNLNWDDCVKQAAEKVSVPFQRFDLKDVARGSTLIEQARKSGRGIVCAHVHGYLVAKGERASIHGIRFSRPDTDSFEPPEVALLEELLAHPTIVAGTSLVGSNDSHQLVGALLPKGDGGEEAAGDDADVGGEEAAEAVGEADVGGEEAAEAVGEAEAAARLPEPLWIFERGPHSLSPGFDTRIAVHLSHALLARNSLRNFVCDTDVDFDMMMTELRATEIGLPWPQGEPPETQLPILEKIVPPNPGEVRHLLDQRYSLIVGAPYVGCSTLAFLIAWWQCLVELGALAEPRGVKGLQGAGQALEYLERSDLEGIGAIVIDDLFDERDGEDEAAALRDRLTKALERAGNRRVLATASADAALRSACQPGGAMHDVFETTVVRARSLWRPDDLRAWARARGGEQAETVCREVRMGVVLTPSQAIRTYEAHVPYEEQEDWRGRLRQHLDRLYSADRGETGESRALALALVRLQDFSVPRLADELSDICGADACREVREDPWNLCTPIEVDGAKYLRLSNSGLTQVVDDWLGERRHDLEASLRNGSRRLRWALDALRHWSVFRDADVAEIGNGVDTAELTMFGSEYVKRALDECDPEAAVNVLWRIWNAKKDHWTAKDVALDLALHWDRLRESSKVWDLRDSLLKAVKPMGAYAMFEAIMRVGRPVEIELWHATVDRLLNMARSKHKSKYARRQVALAFDATLWRRCPVSPTEERKLIKKFLAGCSNDRRLRATMAAACVYHHEGAKRLREAEYELPPLGTDIDLPQAREIAWLVAWHFVHQSRCRALASRRAFLSTMDGAPDAAPRYLDREPRKNPLDEEHKAAVVRFVEALLGQPTTAGWALHLIMNVHATMGDFDVREDHIRSLHNLLSAEQPGSGVLSAVLTYAPTQQIYGLLIDKLRTERAKVALQEGLRKGIEIEETVVAPPRFLMGSDPWAIRHHWDAMPERLPFGAATAQELIEKLAQRIPSAVEEGKVDREQAEHAIAVLGGGHTVAIESWPQPSRSDLDDVLGLLSFVADFYAVTEK